MTSTMAPPERKTAPPGPTFGTLEDLQRPRKTVDVEINGKLYRFQELFHGEMEAITLATRTEEVDAKGNEVRKLNYKGNQARWIAHSWINPDGSLVLAKPMDMWGVLDQLPQDAFNLMWEAVDRLMGLTEKARDELGKGTGRTQGSSGSSG